MPKHAHLYQPSDDRDGYGRIIFRCDKCGRETILEQL